MHRLRVLAGAALALAVAVPVHGATGDALATLALDAGRFVPSLVARLVVGAAYVGSGLVIVVAAIAVVELAGSLRTASAGVEGWS